MRRKYTAVDGSRSWMKVVCDGMFAGRMRATYSMQARCTTAALALQKAVCCSGGAVSSPWTRANSLALASKHGRFTAPPGYSPRSRASVRLRRASCESS